MMTHESHNDIDCSDLIDSLELSGVLDEKLSVIRDWIVNDPSRLPRPLWFGNWPFWPWQQVFAFVKAQEPRDFPADPKDFIPAEVAAFDSGRPAEPFKKTEAASR